MKSISNNKYNISTFINLGTVGTLSTYIHTSPQSDLQGLGCVVPGVPSVPESLSPTHKGVEISYATPATPTILNQIRDLGEVPAD